MRSTRSHKVPRRVFLQAALAGGAGLALGSTSCFEGPATPQAPTPVEHRALHFDLSHVSDHRRYQFTLHVGGQSYPVQTHSEASRSAHRKANDFLEYVSDARLTHFVEAVALPAEMLQLAHVTATDTATGERDLLIAVSVHLPHRILLAQGNADSVQAVRRLKSAMLREYTGLTDLGDDLEPVDLDSFVTPYDSARAFLFHHPNLMNLAPDAAAVILEIIDAHLGMADARPCTVNPNPLVCQIAKAGPGGWMLKKPLISLDDRAVFVTENAAGDTKLITVGDDGAPMLAFEFDDDGQPLRLTDENQAQRRPAYQYEPAPAILQAAASTLRDVLNEAMDDPRLQGICWQIDESGDINVDATSEAVEEPTVLAGEVSLRVGLDNGGARGIEMRLDQKQVDPIEDGSYGTVQVSLMNKFMRYLGVYVQWLDDDDQPLPVSDYVKHGDALGRDATTFWHQWCDTSESFFLGWVSSNSDIMSIPLPFVYTPLVVPRLPEASACRLVVGSLGTGKLTAEATFGSIMTGVVNLALPAYFLASAISTNPLSRKILKDAAEHPDTCKGLMLIGGTTAYIATMQEMSQDRTATTTTGLAKLAGGILVSQGLSKLRVAVVQAAAASAATKSIPFVGWALWAAEIAADISYLAQTIAEVSTTPGMYTNTIRFTWSPTFTFTYDPMNMAKVLPETATRYVCTVMMRGKTAATTKGEIVKPPSGYLQQYSFRINDLIVGGKATYKIQLFDNQGTLVGHAEKEVDNRPVSGAYPDDYTVAITELAAPISASTRYEHFNKIGIQEGKHVWLDTGKAGQPTATIAHLNCSDRDKALCTPVALTISQLGHCAGYVWRASGVPSNLCSGGQASGGSLFVVQNLGLVANGIDGGPEGFLVAPSCSYNLDRPALAYDRAGPVDGDHFFVEPVAVHEYHLRRVVLQPGQLAFGSGQSWGRFSCSPDDLAVYAGGFVAAINKANCRLEILAFGEEPTADNQAPWAALLAGPGSRTGLLGQPVAVAVSQGGTILVLEQNSARTTAFDSSGRCVKAFGIDGQDKRSFFNLRPESEPVTYLDLEVNGELSCVRTDSGVLAHGFLYVLSFVGEGRQPSDYRLDIYLPTGEWLCRTEGVNAARIAVDVFRKLYTLNYETLEGPNGIPEPSLSWWIPR